MPRRPKKATRHGATQPEEARRAVQVMLRLLPGVRDRLDALAEGWEVSRSEAVARLVASAPPSGCEEP